jgi:hypothetical protein
MTIKLCVSYKSHLLSNSFRLLRMSILPCLCFLSLTTSFLLTCLFLNVHNSILKMQAASFSESLVPVQKNCRVSQPRRPVAQVRYDWVKKIWEELITYFTLIWHEPHRKRCIQQFFYCCMCVYLGTYLLSHCLTTVRGYTDTGKVG